MADLNSMKVGSIVGFNLTPRALLDTDAARLFRRSRHVQISSLDLMGSSLDKLPQAFSEVLKMRVGMREKGRRRMRLIGLARTGITSPLALRIAHAVSQLPELEDDEVGETLEMHQVSTPCFRVLFVVRH